MVFPHHIIYSRLVLLRKVVSCRLTMIMKEALRYLAGVAGPSGYGSNSTAEQVTQDCSFLRPPHHPLTAIITGATSGIGVETARVLAKRGVRVVVPARDLKKGSQLKEMIQKESPEAKIILLDIDLGSFASIKSFCSEFLSLNLPLNILINNAGKLSNKLEFSEDKFEMTFATNYLGEILNPAPVYFVSTGHFLLTELLLEKMVETAAQTGIQGRIVNVSSVGHRWVDRDHFNFNQMLQPKNYSGNHAYAQSKLANLLHARRANVTINAVHPGIVKTGIIKGHKSFVTGTQCLFISFSELVPT
ncbi:hypothetical protein RJ640_005165 [Escallonia rubra]|uniref:Short-chain dehydrogenase TIC 32, chloroplastic n=1 Tax=Escallonia rubra TaxID=112253 RepID=A0AA88UWB6_9ASTE|nr:hypothetical protein RJ640_005165 [Escallonia rubra]